MRRYLPLTLALALSAAGLATATWAPAARASLVIALDTPTMVQRADHVAVVDVVSVTSAWDEAHEHILTTIDLAVVESWKGPMVPAAHIKIVQPGGTVGDISMVVHGMTPFSPGERALVFLRGAPGAASVVGMAQGKRAVRRDLSTGKWMVHVPETAGATFVRPKTGTAQTPSTPAVFERRMRALDELRAEIRGMVGKAKAK